MAAPVRAFLSYAHEDHAWRDALLGQLGWLIHGGDLDLFYDPQIAPGQPWNGRIREELAAAEIVLFLVSGHFLRSGFCIKGELLPSLDRHGRDQCAVVPILCEDIDLAGTPLGPLQCLPQDPASNDLKPLKDWEGRTDLALAPVVAKVRGLMQARDARSSAAADLASPVSAPATPAGLPPRGRFVGRRTDLDQLRAWVLDDSPQPIALLGPGGVGKSKLAVAALHDPTIAARFGARRLFVRLEDVRDESGIHAAVARELGVEPGARPAAAVAAALRAGPALLVLDNAETPWEADLPGAEQAFAGLAELPGARLVASLRGFAPPGLADWRPILVEPLPEDPARALFTAIAGARHAGDAALPTLLARLDGLPLAIELVAHRAATEPDAATVLRLWDSERSAFLRRGQGGRKNLDLAVSIALSLASPQMTAPGRRLFAILGRLPHGLARADLPALMPGDGSGAATALARTGLVPPGAERLRLLAPVREHAVEQPLDGPDAAALAAHFAALADALPHLGASATDRVAELRARAELANIEAVLPLDAMPATGTALGRRWVRVGDTRLTLGSLTLAGVAYEHGNRLFSYLASCDPSNAEWQRDLSVSWEKLGDVRRAQGDLPAALQAFTEAKNIADRLATADPGNAGWQFDLGISNERIGDVLKAQGRLDDAAQAYQSKHDVIAKLAAADPGNAQWQRDLSISWIKLGDVRSDQGDLPAALQAYTEAKNIRDRLAAADPGNAQWQRDLSISWIKLGDVRSDQGDLPAALQAFTEAKNIADRLATADPGNAQWQFDLGISNERIGDVLKAQGRLDDAAQAYQSKHDVIAKLAAADPGNAQWQRDLSVSWEKLGDVRSDQGDLPAALQAFTESKNIADRLATADPGNAQWQRDLSVSWEKLGDVRRAQGDLPAALQAFTESKNIADKLAAADPGNAEWQRDLSVSWEKLGDVRRAQGDFPAALQAFTESKNIADRLAAADPGNAQWQRDLSVSWERLASVREGQQDRPGAEAAWRKALAVSERLARDFPDSVAMETTQVVHLAGVARHLNPADPAARTEARRLLDRALAVLQPLAEAGRLDANRLDWIPWIEQQRTALD